MDRYAAYLESARCICHSAIESASKASKPCATVAPSPYFVLPHGQSSAHSYGKGTRTITRRSKAKKPVTKRCYSSAVASINRPHDSDKPIKALPATSVSAGDVEKVAAAREHVVLNVTGMDCSGCASNLTRALQAVPGTDNVKVTFITTTAELDLDPTVTAIPTVIRLAETHWPDIWQAASCSPCGIRAWPRLTNAFKALAARRRNVTRLESL